MTTAAILATWWCGFGIVLGANRSRVQPGPFDGLIWAAAWAFGWPLLWIVEDANGR